MNFTIDPELNGPLLAVIIATEMSVSLLANSSVLIYTVFHLKVLKSPNKIFLTNLILGNLMMTIMYLPSVIVTTSSGEWMFGSTQKQKIGSCTFFAFLRPMSILQTTITLTVLSIERFLYVVKPSVHKYLARTWIALFIIAGVWILSCLLATPPLYGLGEFAFNERTASCVAIWLGHDGYLIFTFLTVGSFISIISFMTTCATCYIMKFKKACKLDAHLHTNLHEQVRCRRNASFKSLRMFSVVVSVNALAYIPDIIVHTIIVSEDTELPIAVHLTVGIISFSVYTLNPLIQMYFREDLNTFVRQRVCNQCCRRQENVVAGATNCTMITEENELQNLK